MQAPPALSPPALALLIARAEAAGFGTLLWAIKKNPRPEPSYLELASRLQIWILEEPTYSSRLGISEGERAAAIDALYQSLQAEVWKAAKEV